MNKKFARNNDDDEEFSLKESGQLQFYTKVNRAYHHDVFIDEPFVDSSYYRTVIAMLNDASPDDFVVFHLNSPGGLLSGLQSLVEAVKQTNAQTIAYIVGQCASAASIFALHCDSIIVGDMASFMVHHVSYSTGGKQSDIISHTQHITKTSERLIRDTYSEVLTEKEIEEVLNGREIYFDADQIRERLAQRDDYLKAKFLAEQEEMKALQEQQDKDEPKPKRKKKK